MKELQSILGAEVFEITGRKRAILLPRRLISRLITVAGRIIGTASREND